MSVANFCTMRDFPLFVKDCHSIIKLCPECGSVADNDASECNCCGCKELEDYCLDQSISCFTL